MYIVPFSPRRRGEGIFSSCRDGKRRKSRESKKGEKGEEGMKKGKEKRINEEKGIKKKKN